MVRAVIDDTCAEVEFGLTEEQDEARLVDGANVDVCRLLAVNRATAFREAAAVSGVHIEAGQTFRQIWDARFAALAAAPIKIVCVVDRYAIQKHHEPSPAGLSGLERFMGLLDQSATAPRYLTIYSAWTSELKGRVLEDVANDVALILSRLPTKRIRRAKVYMAPNAAFRDDGHDRFVRFGDYVWDIGLGLEIFEGAFAAKRSAAAFKTAPTAASYKQVEQDLAGNARTRSVEVTC